MPTILLPTTEDTLHLGYLLGKNLFPGSILLLSGNLGSGKTTLVQGLGQGLNISELIVSPTFTLINEYLDGRIPLYHLDLYRLEPDQVDDIYPEIYWEGEEVEPGITAIEWSERLLAKPPSYLQINLSHSAIAGRQAYFQAWGQQIYNLKFIQNFFQVDQQQ